MPARPIVLDANILIRFILGKKVPTLLVAHAATIDFLAPDTAFEEARKHLPTILRARGGDGTGEVAALDKLDAVTAIVTPVPANSYEPLRVPALARIGQRDQHDWQVLACALLLNCPIWTEDRDFFGTGVATWTTARWSCTSRIQTQGQQNTDPRSMSETKVRAELIHPAPKAAASG